MSDLQEAVSWVTKNPNRVVMICSCPSQIGDDKTIMDQVEKMCRGKDNIELTFSRGDNLAASLFAKGSVESATQSDGSIRPVLTRVGPFFPVKSCIQGITHLQPDSVPEQFLMRQAMGLTGTLPRLLKGESL